MGSHIAYDKQTSRKGGLFICYTCRMNSLLNHALYQVATKALLSKENKILVLITPDGYLDFPGGRVDESERNIPWTEALKREVAEEIGETVNLDIGNTLFVSKRQYHKDGKTNYIAAIFFECQYKSGDLQLSDEHRDLEWLTPNELLNSQMKFVSEDERVQLSALFKSRST